MENAFLLLFCLILIIWGVRFFLTKIPSSSASDMEFFIDNLPEGFVYPYFLDESGYAINMPEAKIFLQTCNGSKIYERNKIREIQWRLDGADKITLHGTLDPGKLANKALTNRKFKKEAYEASGIFITTADIENPVWQIKYNNEAELRRSVEILRQFLDGELVDYQEYVKQNG